jgi:hypothetical protein
LDGYIIGESQKIGSDHASAAATKGSVELSLSKDTGVQDKTGN